MQKIPANELLAGLTLAEPVSIHAVVTDSRKVEPGCVFVCFPGERVDGHDFAAGAYRDGAAYIIANHPVEGVPADRTVIVPDSARAMIRMAANYRMLFSPKMIGVTGSVGKTTTKEFCYAVLSAFGKTLKTEGNQNNDIGVPNTLFRLDDATEYAVVEMGMDHAGEIERLSRCARPELTERCDLDPAMISRVLADLVRSGLVQKCGAPGKYNAIYRLTDAGRDRAVRVRAVVADVSRRADEGIDPGELAIFYKVLAQLTENLEAVEADPTAAFAPLED